MISIWSRASSLLGHHCKTARLDMVALLIVALEGDLNADYSLDTNIPTFTIATLYGLHRPPSDVASTIDDGTNRMDLVQAPQRRQPRGSGSTSLKKS